MIAAGHHVDPTDGVLEIALKAEELLKIPVRVMRFEELDASAVYDAVWAIASLLHVPRPALPSILTKVRQSLKPGGLHSRLSYPPVAARSDHLPPLKRIRRHSVAGRLPLKGHRLVLRNGRRRAWPPSNRCSGPCSLRLRTATIIGSCLSLNSGIACGTTM